MGKVNINLIDTRLKFYRKMLSLFTEINTAVAFIVVLEYLAEYVLTLFSADLNSKEKSTGASVASKVGNDPYYANLVNLRNAVVHYDYTVISCLLQDIQDYDYTEFVPIKADLTIINSLSLFSTVNWDDVKSFLLNV